ncbi:MAG TPA: MFS transporter [Myxococcota bacterium]|jgi:MFS family permease
MTENDRPATLRRDLRAIVGDGVAFSVMVGAGETYIPAFALAAGLGEITAGLVATLPMLVGAAFQLVSPAAVRRLGSRRRWVVLCASAQAASFAPLVVAALAGRLSRPVLFFAAALYWGFGMATGPAWNAWITQIVPRPIRSRFFAVRARWSQAAVLAGLLAGGVSLQAGVGAQRPLLIFAALFGTALLARAVSSRFLASQSEPEGPAPDTLRISPRAFWATFRDPAHGRLLLFLIWLQMGVHVSAPYFTPFMLGPLKLSYGEYAVLTGIAFVARIAAMPALGSLAHRAGSRRLLWIASVGIVPLPACWLISQHFAWLLLVQVAAGIAWGAFELATLLVFFDDIPDRRRTSVLSIFNLANAIAVVIGAGAGSLLFRAFGPQLPGYAVLFVVSSCLRIAGLLWLRRSIGSYTRPIGPA